jgi:hypothetical protein
MSLDIQTIRRALAGQISENVTATPNIYAYIPSAPKLPCLGISAGEPYVHYSTTMGHPEADLHLLVRVITAGRAEDAMVFLDDMLSAGSSTTSSIVDAIRQDPTLGGLVEQCVPSASSMVAEGEDNTTGFQAVVPVDIWLRQDF